MDGIVVSVKLRNKFIRRRQFQRCGFHLSLTAFLLRSAIGAEIPQNCGSFAVFDFYTFSAT
jgi:hypothetical protein